MWLNTPVSGCESGAFGQRAQLGPHDRRRHATQALALGEAAVRAGDDILAADQLRIADDPFRHQVRMLDQRRAVADHAGNERFAIRQAHVAPDLPLVRVAGVACFDGVRARVDAQQQIDDI